jgi:sortase A
MRSKSRTPNQRRPGAQGGARVRFATQALRRVEGVCWCLAALLLGAYALVYLDRTVYQAFQEWSFDRALAEPKVETGAKPAPRPPLQPGSLIGRIEIERVGVQAIIVESTTTEALRRAVGHIEGTALPGEDGNIGLAGHRDTFFQGLQEVRRDDVIRIDTLEGSWEYRVESTRVVEPGEIEVLKASAGSILTLVTCYPFNYVGAAPRRFIVQAREIRPPPKGGEPERRRAAATPRLSPGF